MIALVELVRCLPLGFIIISLHKIGFFSSLVLGNFTFFFKKVKHSNPQAHYICDINENNIFDMYI